MSELSWYKLYDIDEVFGHPTRDLSRVHFDKVDMVDIVHSSRINAVHSIGLLSIKNA